ncbi:nose resistant to fluoxetine protein 6-like [Anastrepha ludens]|uniref:nose resistant to fluoxetine protein 6-like n=1 Tax=Anastrepha ludens TaxID=28586 RepID=UPI0023B14206|nr:nose resistant to fluoxetine protein 6-like [Anastrepha ludens]
MKMSRMLSFVAVLYALVSVCAAGTGDPATNKVGVDARLDWSTEKYEDFEYVVNAAKLPFEDGSAPLTPNERQLFAYSLTKVEGKQCRDDLNATLWGILSGQRWAIAMYDAMAKSAAGIDSGALHQFGHFDECLDQQRFHSNTIENQSTEFVVRSKYCLVDVQMDGFAMQTAGSRQKEALNRNGDALVVAFWGACVPASCASTDIVLFLQNYLQRPVLSANETACQLSSIGAGNGLHVDGGMFTYAVVLFVFVLLATLSTAFHCYLIYVSRNADDVSKRALQQETLTIALLSFSVIENTKKLFQASKDHMGLNSINGIKAIAMLLILAGHALSFIYSSPSYNVAFVAEQTKFPTFAFLYNSLLFVDTFLLLSGFLFCRIMLVELDRRRGHINPLILYVGRYIRLTPAYMAIIGFYMTWFPSIGSGPLWRERITREQERCQASWWLNILYVNNYFNTDKFCMFQSWYLSVDTQLFFIAPIFIYLLYKVRKCGKRLLIAAVVCTTIIPFVVTFVRHLDPTLLVFADELIDLASNNYYIGYYVKTHMRASSYFIGLLTGFLVHAMQERGTKLHTVFVRLTWLVSTVIGIASIFSVCRFYRSPFTFVESFLYAGFHKVAWNLSVAWLVMAATTGHAGWLQNFLSSRFFVPISRLTYCAYLSNGIVELYHSSTLRYGSYQSYVNLENKMISHTVDTFALAFVLCLLFESPIHALERILLRKAGRPSEKRTPSTENQSPSTSEEQVA